MVKGRYREQGNLRFFGSLVPVVLLLLFLVGPVTAKESPRISYGSLPGWVLDAQIPDANKERIRAANGGIYHLIDDTQIKIGTTGSDYFLRTTRKVINRSGLEDASTIQLNFDPEIDDLVLHRAAVWRDGKMIDQTDTASVEMMRRESELEDGIITGQRTANVRLDDVRVDDITDIAWSLNEKKSYWPGHFFGRFDLGWSVPVAMTRLRIVAPHSLEIRTKLSNGTQAPERAHKDDETILTWTVIDPKPVPSEDDTPEWLEQRPSVELSTMANWSDVVSWAAPYYDVDSSLPADLARKVDAIATGSKDPMIRASKALWLVQDSIRYTSLSIGVGGYRPRAPAVTWQSGFGDCKDKTALLIAVLGRLGIRAEPALTHMRMGPGLENLLPRANVFDHVIVRIDFPGKPVWLDPTGSHEGGIIPNIADQTYGYALPLSDGQDKLEQIPAPTPEDPTIEIVESHLRTDKGIEISISATYKRDEANIKRSDIADSSLASIEKNELEFYRAMYPDIEHIGELTVDDDRDKNILVVNQSYFLPATSRDYEDTITSYQINAWTVDDLFVAPDASRRKTAIALPYQINRRHIIKLTTPGTRPGLPADKKISGKAFEFNRTSVRDGDSATIEINLVGKKTVLEAADVAAYRKDTERLSDLSYEFIDLDDEFGFIDSDLFLFAFGLAVVGGSIILVMAVQALKAAESAGTVSGLFRPIGIFKFLILSVCTFNIYVFYWFWRCWRRHRQTENVDISPFWRAMFSIFWVFELFKAAQEQAEFKKPIWIGIAASIGYFLFTVVSSLAESFNAPMGLEASAAFLGIIVLIPVVQQVNLANDPQLVAASSRFTGRDWLAVCCGLPLSLLLLTV